MKFLKDIYASELDSPDFGLVNIEEKYDADGYLTHDVVIDGKIYSPSKILLDNDEDFNQAFIDWKERKFDELIEKADSILKLYDNKERFGILKKIFDRKT